jgi:adenosylcobinamide-phosphate synthase
VSGGAVVVAGVLDAVLREPPRSLHPVRAIGRYLDAAAIAVPAEPPRRAVLSGGAAWLVGAAAAVTAGGVVERAVRDMSSRRRAVVLGVALWPLLSGRLLLDEVAAVERALAVDLEAGRAAVARIVSRDVSGLSETQVRQAGLESLAENLSDSVVAPLLWFGLGGLPAALAYRFANTADAMWGYRTPRWRHAGAVAARADDMLNLAPARVTGMGLIGIGLTGVGPARVRWAGLRRAARETPSPNAGWPMAALALRLGIRLEKPGVYTLNPTGRPPEPADTAAALRLVRRRIWATFGAAALVAGLRRWGRR